MRHVGTRKAGEIFGELALMSNKPRAATITALEETHIATLDRRTFDIVKKNFENVLNKKIEIIKESGGSTKYHKCYFIFFE